MSSSDTPRTEWAVGVLVAVREELRAILRRMPPAETESAGGIAFHHGTIGGKPVVVACSGMGTARAERTARAMIERHRPSLLIVAGFAAGLSEGVEPTDLIVADAVYREEPGTSAKHRPCVSSPMRPPLAALTVARSVGTNTVRAHVGALLTGPDLVRTPSHKRHLAALAPGLIAYDMESAGAVGVAENESSAWLVVRSVTDGPYDMLPVDFAAFTDIRSGEVNPSMLAAYVALRPWKIPGLVRLAARASRAARNMAAFVEAYVRALPSE